MRSKFLILTLIYLLIGVKPVLAGDPPILINPTNNSTVSSSKLQWQTPSYAVCQSFSAYRIQVSNNSAFPSSGIYRDSYTSNTYYTPQLTLGNWYWRVMARDETCNKWSNWSDAWSFILMAATPSLSPSPTPSPAKPSPTATPTPKPTTKPSQVSTPMHTQSPSSTPYISPAANSYNPPAQSQSIASDPDNPNQSESPSFAWAHQIANSASKSASVAGVESSNLPDSEVNVPTKEQSNLFTLLGYIFVIIGISSLGFIIYKISPFIKRGQINS